MSRRPSNPGRMSFFSRRAFLVSTFLSMRLFRFSCRLQMPSTTSYGQCTQAHCNRPDSGDAQARPGQTHLTCWALRSESCLAMRSFQAWLRFSLPFFSLFTALHTRRPAWHTVQLYACGAAADAQALQHSLSEDPTPCLSTAC